MRKHGRKRTPRVWPTDHLIRRFIWISLLSRSQKLFSKTMEEWPQMQFRDHQGWLLGLKRGHYGLVFKTPMTCTHSCGGRTTISVGPKGRTSILLGLYGGAFNQRRLFLSLIVIAINLNYKKKKDWSKRFHGLCFTVCTYSGWITPFSCLFIPLKWERLSWVCPTTVFWKPITYVVS